MTRGRGPGGRYLYPAFPYTSYTKMTRRDLLDLKAYIFRHGDRSFHVLLPAP
jgi:hypothetical protein